VNSTRGLPATTRSRPATRDRAAGSFAPHGGCPAIGVDITADQQPCPNMRIARPGGLAGLPGPRTSVGGLRALLHHDWIGIQPVKISEPRDRMTMPRSATVAAPPGDAGTLPAAIPLTTRSVPDLPRCLDIVGSWRRRAPGRAFRPNPRPPQPAAAWPRTHPSRIPAKRRFCSIAFFRGADAF